MAATDNGIALRMSVLVKGLSLRERAGVTAASTTNVLSASACLSGRRARREEGCFCLARPLNTQRTPIIEVSALDIPEVAGTVHAGCAGGRPATASICCARSGTSGMPSALLYGQVPVVSTYWKDALCAG